MAKIVTMKDPNTGEVHYPVTAAQAVIDKEGVDIDTRLVNERNERMGDIQAVKELIEEKPGASELSNVLADGDLLKERGTELPIYPQTVARNVNTNSGTDVEMVLGEIADEIDKKLDSTTWTAEHEQWSLPGHFWDVKDGKLKEGTNWMASALMPLDTTRNIEFFAQPKLDGNAGTVFFDGAHNFLGGIGGAANTAKQTIHPEEMPANAVYFAVSKHSSSQARYTNTPTQEIREGLTAGAIAASKKALFIDMWKERGHGWSGYNEKTGYFFLNEIYDISYEEALAIFNASFPSYVGSMSQNFYDHSYPNVRTLFAVRGFGGKDGTGLYRYCKVLEHVLLIDGYHSYSSPGASYSSVTSMFYQCVNLRKIIGVLELNHNSTLSHTASAFSGCSALEHVLIKINAAPSSALSLGFRDCPLLSLDSIKYMVENIAESTSANITVHPDVYAKLTDVTNSEWHEVLVAATAKNISFATV